MFKQPRSGRWTGSCGSSLEEVQKHIAVHAQQARTEQHAGPHPGERVSRFGVKQLLLFFFFFFFILELVPCFTLARLGLDFEETLSRMWVPTVLQRGMLIQVTKKWYLVTGNSPGVCYVA